MWDLSDGYAEEIFHGAIIYCLNWSTSKNSCLQKGTIPLRLKEWQDEGQH